MRFIRGRTLSESIKAYHEKVASGMADPLGLRELLSAFVGVCNAVAYAHSRGVIHRDLKGQNVVVGDFGEVMVLDWGLAKIAGHGDEGVAAGGPGLLETEQDAGHEETRQGQVLGTPAYMAPEQALGQIENIDTRTDIYGLGAILYEILTGRAPFVANSLKELLSERSARTPRILPAACIAVRLHWRPRASRPLPKDPRIDTGRPQSLPQETLVPGSRTSQ